MTQAEQFDPTKHIEVDGGFAPKSVEADLDTAYEMADAAIMDEETRLKKGQPAYNLQPHRISGSIGTQVVRHRGKYRAKAEEASELVKMEMGGNDDAIVKLTKKAEPSWSIDVGGLSVSKDNLTDVLPFLSRDERKDLIASLQKSQETQLHKIHTRTDEKSLAERRAVRINNGKYIEGLNHVIFGKATAAMADEITDGTVAASIIKSTDNRHNTADFARHPHKSNRARHISAN